MYRKFCK